MLINTKATTYILCAVVCILLCGCRKTTDSDFGVLPQLIEKGESHLPQEAFEKHLKTLLDEYFYYEGGITYEAPLMVYKGEKLDYVVLQDDKVFREEAGYFYRRVFVLLQPQKENLSTAMVEIAIYNDTMYALSFRGRIDGRIDFEDAGEVEENLSKLLGTECEFEKIKMQYAGTLPAGKGEEPQYGDFEGKEMQVAEIQEWTENYLERSEITEETVIYIRDFRQEDSHTEVLIEMSLDGEKSYLFLPYYFYQENNFQKPFELAEGEHSAYLTKLKHKSIK